MSLLWTVAVAIVLTITPTKGKAPLDAKFKLTVEGPFNGEICLSYLRQSDGDMQVVGCSEYVIGEGKTDVEFPLTGRVRDVYQFKAFLHKVGQEDVFSNVVEVTVE